MVELKHPLPPGSKDSLLKYFIARYFSFFYSKNISYLSSNLIFFFQIVP
jgi:hypothetical protein